MASLDETIRAERERFADETGDAEGPECWSCFDALPEDFVTLAGHDLCRDCGAEEAFELLIHGANATGASLPEGKAEAIAVVRAWLDAQERA